MVGRRVNKYADSVNHVIIASLYKRCVWIVLYLVLFTLSLFDSIELSLNNTFINDSVRNTQIFWGDLTDEQMLEKIRTAEQE